MQDSEPPFACEGCSAPLGFDISMAYQPIIDLFDGSVFAYEALVRGVDGASAASVLARVNDTNRFAFDQTCRVRAVELAAKLGIDTRVSINFMPNAVYEPNRCLRTTLAAAARAGFPADRIIFETTEDDRVRDPVHFRSILVAYKQQGFLTAIDDFGAGYSGLSLLAEFQPDIIKLDRELIRGIDDDRPRQAIVAGMVGICRMLGIKVIAEGIERPEEMTALATLGVTLMQGYLFARPGFETLPQPEFPGLVAAEGGQRRQL